VALAFARRLCPVAALGALACRSAPATPAARATAAPLGVCAASASGVIAARDSAGTGVREGERTRVRWRPRVTLATDAGGAAAAARPGFVGHARVTWDSATVIVGRDGRPRGASTLMAGRRVTAVSVPGVRTGVWPPEFLAARIVVEDSAAGATRPRFAPERGAAAGGRVAEARCARNR
jgi:hypothetical protein